MALITAPTIIISIDDSVDISCFYSLGEEEVENFELPFDNNTLCTDNITIIKANDDRIGYTFKVYPKPHLNLITPPPERS